MQVVNHLKKSLLVALLVWMGIVSLSAGVIWGYEVHNFLRELNEIKSILGILPINLVREIPQAVRYIKEILDSNKSFF